MIDDKNRILFCGDACNNHLLFRLGPGEPGFISTEEAGENLERIWNMRDRYDIVMNSHHDYRAVGDSSDGYAERDSVLQGSGSRNSASDADR